MPCRCKLFVETFRWETGHYIEYQRINGVEKAEILYKGQPKKYAFLELKTLCSRRFEEFRSNVGTVLHITIDGNTKHFIVSSVTLENEDYHLGIYKIRLEGFIEEDTKVELGS